MKRWFKNGLYAALLVAGLAFTSCGDKNKQPDTDPDSVEATDTLNSLDAETEVDTAAINPDTIMGP